MPEEPPSADAPPTEPSVPRRIARALSFRRASLLYVFVVIVAIFAVWVPHTFLTSTTLRTLLDEQAFTAIAALGLIVALSAGVFDLAIGSEIGLGAILSAWLVAEQGVPTGLAILLTVVAGMIVGLVNGLLVTRARIDSFIATLGVSSILTAMATWVSGGNEILNLPHGFSVIGSNTLLGLQYPVYYMLGIGIVVWYVMARTAVGRRVYATGGNREAAHLSGVRTALVIVVSFAVCGGIAGLSGMLISGSLDAGDPTIGPSYLLSAFSAAFLGSTQFRPGRFNVLGTIVAVYVLATGVKGLQLAGAPIWIPDLFNGSALLIAVGLASSQRRPGQVRAISRLVGPLLRRGSSAASVPPAPTPPSATG